MEIGSEYWLEKIYKGNLKIEEKDNQILFMSGRTAIDYAIDLIEKHKKVKNVYMPSYCCSSMLAPFIERNIKIEFYTVSFNGEKFVYDIDSDKDCDIFFAMNYFGFTINNMDFYIDIFKNKNKNTFIIEDSTHSLLSKRIYNGKSDFVVASLRKFFPIISGGILIANNTEFIPYIKEDKKDLKSNVNYSTIKEQAMIEKAKYINKEEINKEEFLGKFKKANYILDIDYKRYKIDNKSYEILENMDLTEIVNKRKNNSKIIYTFLASQKNIKYIKYNEEDDCPLFIPIILEENERNELKKYLVENGVYCPNHWPIPSLITDEKQRKIYNMELSLICDQRYSEQEIQSYVELIKNREL